MRFILPILVIFLCSCSEKIKTTERKKEANPQVSVSENKEEDSTIYIGLVEDFYFSDKPIVYTELFFNREINTYEEYESITDLAEEVIYEDEENSRRLLPTQIAQENFDLRNLDQMWFFDKNNTQLGSLSEVKSYEYLNQNISPMFIAVYETSEKFNQVAYCIGGNKPNFDELTFEKDSNAQIISKIEKYFSDKEILTSYTLDHVQYKVNDSLLFTFSNTNNFAFIHKTSKSGETILIYEDEGGEFSNFRDLQFIPIIKNEMPILLCDFVRPETDMYWSEVLVFEKGKYVHAKRQRVKIDNL